MIDLDRLPLGGNRGNSHGLRSPSRSRSPSRRHRERGRSPAHSPQGPRHPPHSWGSVPPGPSQMSHYPGSYQGHHPQHPPPHYPQNGSHPYPNYGFDGDYHGGVYPGPYPPNNSGPMQHPPPGGRGHPPYHQPHPHPPQYHQHPNLHYSHGAPPQADPRRYDQGQWNWSPPNRPMSPGWEGGPGSDPGMFPRPDSPPPHREPSPRPSPPQLPTPSAPPGGRIGSGDGEWDPGAGASSRRSGFGRPEPGSRRGQAQPADETTRSSSVGHVPALLPSERHDSKMKHSHTFHSATTRPKPVFPPPLSAFDQPYTATGSGSPLKYSGEGKDKWLSAPGSPGGNESEVSTPTTAHSGHSPTFLGQQTEEGQGGDQLETHTALTLLNWGAAPKGASSASSPFVKTSRKLPPILPPSITDVCLLQLSAHKQPSKERTEKGTILISHKDQRRRTYHVEWNITEVRYFEVQILRFKHPSELSIGLVSEKFRHARAKKEDFPGHLKESVGYHSDGSIMHYHSILALTDQIEEGDSIGCGVTPNRCCFFTRNGRLTNIGPSPFDSNVGLSTLLPGVGLSLDVKVRLRTDNYKEYCLFSPLSLGFCTSRTIRQLCYNSETGILEHVGREARQGLSALGCLSWLQLPVPYYEVELKKLPVGSRLVVGCAAGTSWRVAPGEKPVSCGWFSSDGKIHCCLDAGGDSEWVSEEPPLHFHEGDVVGCGVNTNTHLVFWTKNGSVIATGVEIPRSGRLFPALGMESGAAVRLVFRGSPKDYRFDPSKRLRNHKEEREKARFKLCNEYIPPGRRPRMPLLESESEGEGSSSNSDEENGGEKRPEIPTRTDEGPPVAATTAKRSDSDKHSLSTSSSNSGPVRPVPSAVRNIGPERDPMGSSRSQGQGGGEGTKSRQSQIGHTTASRPGRMLVGTEPRAELDVKLETRGRSNSGRLTTTAHHPPTVIRRGSLPENAGFPQNTEAPPPPSTTNATRTRSASTIDPARAQALGYSVQKEKSAPKVKRMSMLYKEEHRAHAPKEEIVDTTNPVRHTSFRITQAVKQKANERKMEYDDDSD